MLPGRSTRRPRASEQARLRARLEEAEQTLEAIRDGSVDALVVSTAEGERVYALRTADRSYRRIVESVHEGAATVTEAGTVFYANRYLAELVEVPLEQVIGSSFAAWVEEPEAFEAWLRNTGLLGVPLQTRLACRSGRSVPVYLTLSRLEGEEGAGLVLMVSDLRPQQRHEALVASEELSRSILEQAADAVVVCDLNGSIVRASEAAKRLCPEGLLQRPFESAFGIPLPADHVRGLEVVLGSGNGLVTTMWMRARPLRGPEEIVGTVVTLTDISERKRAEEAIHQLHRAEREAREAAEASSRAKDEFLAMLGHELRNPMFAVRNAVEVARTGDGGHRDQALDIAARGVRQLARLVDDLLDVARIQRGRIELRCEVVSVARVVERAVEVSLAASAEREREFEVRVEPGLEVDADPARLEQVLTNLLSNAVKYTDAGGRISVTAEREGAEVVLKVRDDGVGIDPELLSHVFDLFAQGARGLDRSSGGLGIGLTVTKLLVELHGGRVEARSGGAGRGTEVEIRLPASERAQPRVEGQPAASAPNDERMRVLLVEDNPDAAESLAMLLSVLGHQVRAVHDASAALDAVKADPPDVALVDIGLPGMDGYELARELRGIEAAANMTLVALTGYGLSRDKEHAAEAGFHAHLVKPIGVEDLQRVLRFRA